MWLVVGVALHLAVVVVLHLGIIVDNWFVVALDDVDFFVIVVVDYYVVAAVEVDHYVAVVYDVYHSDHSHWLLPFLFLLLLLGLLDLLGRIDHLFGSGCHHVRQIHIVEVELPALCVLE